MTIYGLARASTRKPWDGLVIRLAGAGGHFAQNPADRQQETRKREKRKSRKRKRRWPVFFRASSFRAFVFLRPMTPRLYYTDRGNTAATVCQAFCATDWQSVLHTLRSCPRQHAEAVGRIGNPSCRRRRPFRAKSGRSAARNAKARKAETAKAEKKMARLLSRFFLSRFRRSLTDDASIVLH